MMTSCFKPLTAVRCSRKDRPTCGRVTRLWAGLWLSLLALAPAGPAPAQTDWPAARYDPGADGAGPADLAIPLPCGGAMAFQRVVVPVAYDDPLADAQLRLGQSQPDTGFADYLRPSYLRGGFPSPEEGGTAYFLARYELTQGQYRALDGDCEDPGRAGRLAQGGISWFEAVELSRRLTEWVLVNAPDSLPTAPGGTAFFRLPTEAEWEYAARGGAVIDPAVFPARLSVSPAELDQHAQIFTPGAARQTPTAVATRQPNPLGLFDIYGNAEELMLEPFRLNAVGRAHGQPGGLVTRGGSIRSVAPQIYSAARTEYPLFDTATGAALALPTFGLRLAISAPVTNDSARLAVIRDRWIALSEAEGDATADPQATLADLIEAEIDPRRRTALEGLQLDVRLARTAATEAVAEATGSALLSGAVLVDTLRRQTSEIDGLVSELNFTNGRLRLLPVNSPDYQRLKTTLDSGLNRLDGMRVAQGTFLQAFRTVLESLTRESVDTGAGTDLPEVAGQLRRELEVGGQQALLTNLNHFLNDLGAYKDEPDLGLDKLLRLAVED